MPTPAIGRPTLDPWVQPSMALFCNTHVCVLTAAIWFAKVVECSTPSVDSLIDICCNTHVFSRQQWVGQASIGLFCNTHLCVLTEAIGLAKLLNVQNPQLTSSSFYSAAHKCVCSQQQLVGQPSARHPCWPKGSKGQHTRVC